MKTVSTFELLVKRILPLNPPFNPDSASNAVARRVVQGHFLSITNLELSRPLYFSASYYVADSASDGTQNEFRDLFFDTITRNRNFDLRFDGNNAANNLDANVGVTLSQATVPPFPFRIYRTLKSPTLILGPGETGLLALFPNLAPLTQPPALANILNPIATVSPNLEIRGFIKIQQESSVVLTTGVTETNPFVNQPANILLSSELRGTFLDNDFGAAEVEATFGTTQFGFDFDQIAYALPLAEGKSMYTLDGV